MPNSGAKKLRRHMGIRHINTNNSLISARRPLICELGYSVSMNQCVSHDGLRACHRKHLACGLQAANPVASTFQRGAQRKCPGSVN